MKIAYLACAATLPDAPNRLDYAFEHDEMIEALAPAFAKNNHHIEPVAWDDHSFDWRSVDAAVVGSTWDYWDRFDDFIAALDQINAKTRLFNSPSLVKWNAQKSYLRTLEEKDVPTVPTLWLDRADTSAVEQAFDALETDDLVLKRQIGGNAEGQHRIKRGDAVPAMPEPMMAQPFLRSIQQEGEFSFVVIDGKLCHAVRKTPGKGDYRIQRSYGGSECPADASPEDIKAAENVLTKIDEMPLYARVDMVRGDNGALMLMELELIEPFLYPKQGPDLGNALCRALEQRLA